MTLQTINKVWGNLKATLQLIGEGGKVTSYNFKMSDKVAKRIDSISNVLDSFEFKKKN